MPTYAAALPAQDIEQASSDRPTSSPDLAGVVSLPLTGAPGPVLALGSARSLIDAPDGAGSVLVQSDVGKGTVLAFAHGGYLSRDSIKNDPDLRECMRRVVAWAHARDTASPIVLDGAGTAVLDAVGADPAWPTVKKSWRDALDEKAILIVDSHQFTKDTDAAKLRSFVERGGTLITSGLAWGWLQLNEGKTISDHPGNRSLIDLNIAFADGTIDGDRNNRYPVSSREHPTGADDIDAIMRITRGEEGINSERINGALERTRLALRTLTPEQSRRILNLEELMAGSADAINASFARMKESGLRPGRDPLAMLACEQFASASFELPPREVTAHPSAAAFPGIVAADADRSERTVEIDTTLPGWRATGLFVPAGELVRVTLSQELVASGLRLQIGAHLDPALRPPLRRLPKVTREFTVDAVTTEVASAVGGLLYLVVPAEFAPDSVRLTVTGAVQTPHFVLGKTSVQAWRDSIRNAPGTWGELESREIALTVPSDLLRTLDDPQQLLELWDRIVQAQGSLEPRRLNGLGDRQARYVPDPHVSWGYMYAPAHRPLTIPMSAAKNFIDAKMLATNADGDAWGLFHELGHWHQNDMWTFDGTGEVTVNIFTLYTIDKICGLPSAKAREDVFTPEKMLDTMRKHVAQGSPFGKWKSDPFLALTMYVQIEQAFGWEAYREVFAKYRGLPENQRPSRDEDQRDMWMVMMSRQIGRDLGPFFEAWGVPVSSEARASIADLPDWMPDNWSDTRIVPPAPPGSQPK
jgi:hypothetical protein